MADGDVVALRGDAEKAKQIRDDLAPLLSQVCEVLNRARADGLIVNFQIGMNQYGRMAVQDISVTKPL